MISTKSRLIKQLPCNAPESYITHSENEKECAKHVQEFQANFIKDHPGLKDRVSFLQPLNEYNVRKFACTTIQPTLVPHPELYDLRKAAEYVARCVDYEPLKSNDSECVVVSPAQTLSWAVGDTFDISFVLTSLLIGAGYDAYILLGKAPDYIRLNDQSHIKCIVENTQHNGPKKWSVDATLNDEYAPDKESGGFGLHCWILVKQGNRNLNGGPCFVEPSTGILYKVGKDAPYSEIWCAWNDKNYWVNTSLKPTVVIDDFRSWVQVLPYNAPFSWVKKLEIPTKQFALLYPPSGRKYLVLDKAKIEHFGESVDPQGVVTRITQFDDKDQTVAVCITELFSMNRRSDNLIERTRRPLLMSYDEQYSIKNAHSIRERRESKTQRSINFHVQSRADGLIERIEDKEKCITEHFHGRSDFLLRREIYLERLSLNTRRPKYSNYITFGNGLSFSEIIQIDEHYKEPINESATNQSVAIRSYRLKEKRIVLTYHCEHEALQSRVTHEKDEISKPDSMGHDLLKLEALSILSVKMIQDEMIEIRESMYQRDLELANSATHIDDNDPITTIATPTEDAYRQEKQENDYLSPYVAQIENEKGPMTIEEAFEVRSACLCGVKERLMERAKIMQSRLDFARKELTRRQEETFQNKRLACTLEEQWSFELAVTDEAPELDDSLHPVLSSSTQIVAHQLRPWRGT